MNRYARADRVSRLIQEALSDILKRHINDPRLKMTIITGVQMSPDLKIARIYFSTSGGDIRVREAQKAFQRAYGFLRRELGKELELRYTPALKFFYDDSYDYGEKIDYLLKSIKKNDGSDHSATE
jgi:ribosome-binding factor A